MKIHSGSVLGFGWVRTKFLFEFKSIGFLFSYLYLNSYSFSIDESIPFRFEFYKFWISITIDICKCYMMQWGLDSEA